MGWFFKSPKWLLLILGGTDDTVRDIETNLERAAQIAECTLPNYEIEEFFKEKEEAETKLPIDKYAHIGTAAENVLEQEFNELILNNLIISKKKHKAAKVALIMFRNAFPETQTLEEIVKSIYHDENIYHIVCSNTTFINTKKRKDCYETSCDKCNNVKGCEHSCLIRLLWLMFDKDKRVLNVLDAPTESENTDSAD